MSQNPKVTTIKLTESKIRVEVDCSPPSDIDIITVTLGRLDDIESAMAVSWGIDTDETVPYQRDVELSFDRPTIFGVIRIEFADEREHVIDAWEWQPGDSDFSGVVMGSDAAVSLQDLMQQRFQRYAKTFGVGEYSFRVLTLFEGVFTTSFLRFPGIRIIPIDGGNAYSDDAKLIASLMRQIGWATAIPESKRLAHDLYTLNPWTAVVVDDVRSQSCSNAIDLVLPEIERVGDILAFERGASPLPICIIAEAKDGGHEIKIQSQRQRYRGDILGGPISGEDQRTYLVDDAGLQKSSVLLLATRMFSEAQAERIDDNAYFRFWALLELLATHEVAPNLPVILLNGTPWPNGGNSNNAAPRVYALFKLWISAEKVPEINVQGPAASLFEAVQAWYARRNATAHFGRFDSASALQQAKLNHFTEAKLTLTGRDPRIPFFDNWLRCLQSASKDVLRWLIDKEGVGADG